MGRKSYSKEELENFLYKFKLENDRFPERRDFEGNRDYPSYRQYHREWGSWGNAFVELGIRDTLKEKKALRNHKCLTCKGEFQTYVDSQIYCSIQCRDSHKEVINIKNKGAQKSKWLYRRVAFSRYEWKCAICSYSDDIEYLKPSKRGKKNSDEFPTILDVHHIDHDRSNNSVDNLAILCPTCHAKVHRGIYANIRREGKFKKLKFDKVPLGYYNQAENKKAICMEYKGTKV